MLCYSRITFFCTCLMKVQDLALIFLSLTYVPSLISRIIRSLFWFYSWVIRYFLCDFFRLSGKLFDMAISFTLFLWKPSKIFILYHFRMHHFIMDFLRKLIYRSIRMWGLVLWNKWKFFCILFKLSNPKHS